MIDYDVAIIGYGPTGMMLAGALGRMGHRVVVLERYKTLYNLPRAACFDDETMRSFQKLGVAEGVGKGSVVQDNYDWVNADGQTLVKLEYDRDAAGGWAAMHMMYQPDIETVLDQFDKSLATVDVRHGVTITNACPQKNAMAVEGTDSAGRAVAVNARYVVGCDGGNGFSRAWIGTDVDDYGFQENWLVCDFRMKRAVRDLPMFRQVCDPAQPRSIVRIGPDHHRFSFMLDPGVSAQDATNTDSAWSRVADHIGPDDAELIRVANYVFRSRIAQNWRKGRFFLAGDAAHEMPPFLGQGMCSGIRDAHNLAWKLDTVLRGVAKSDLLDSYQTEREPHVRFITEKAIELGRVQTLRDPIAARERDARMFDQRRRQQTPDKIALPGLTAGFIDGDGSYFPQAVTSNDGQVIRFDDIAGSGWWIVLNDPALSQAVTATDRQALKALGGAVIDLSDTAAPPQFSGMGAQYSDWFEARDCAAVVVRPDRYVYGTAQNSAGLRSLLDRLFDAFTLTDSSGKDL